MDGTIGGSYYSLLFLAQGLNKDIYNPIVAFYRDNPLIKRFKSSDINVILINKPNPINLSNIFNFKGGSFLRHFHIFRYIFSLFQKTYNFFSTFFIPIFTCYRIIKRYKINIVHLNNTFLRPQEWIFACFLSNTKIVAHERGINKNISNYSRFLARFFSYIICISKTVENNLIKNGFPPKQIITIYNGLDSSSFTPSVSSLELFDHLNIPRSSRVVGMIGNIKPWKGQEIVIKAVEIVKQHFPDTICLLVGAVSNSSYEQTFFKKLKTYVKENDLEDNIIFTGSSDDIPSIINIMEIVIHASIEPEPFGRVILEGMALKKPVITNDIGAGSEIVIHNETGLVVKSGDSYELAQAIIELLYDKKLSAEMGVNGFDRLQNYFHLNIHIKMVEQLYSSL